MPIPFNVNQPDTFYRTTPNPARILINGTFGTLKHDITGKDVNPVVNIKFRGTNHAGIINNSTKTWYCAFNSMDSGAYKATVTATYLLHPGNNKVLPHVEAKTIEIQVLIVIDDNDPIINFNPPIPANIYEKDTPSFLVTVNADIIDPGSGIEQIQVLLDNNAVLDLSFSSRIAGYNIVQDVKLLSIGVHQLVVRAKDRLAHLTELTFSITAIDNVPPRFTTDPPQNNQVILATALPQMITIKGTAWDTQSGMKGGNAGVWWALNNTIFSPVLTSDSWATWMADIPLNGYGTNKILFKFSDRKGNSTIWEYTYKVVSTYKPTTLAERVNRRAYLEDLLQFAADHVIVNNSTPPDYLDTLEIEQYFYQEYQGLSQPLSLQGEQPLTQIRIAIEILNKFISKEIFTNILGHWSFDEYRVLLIFPAQYIFFDSIGKSGQAKLGVAPEYIKYAPYRGGSALALDGTNQFAKINNLPHLEIGKNDLDFTVSFSIYLEDNINQAQWRSVIHKGSLDTERTVSCFLVPNSNYLHVRVSTVNNWNEGIDQSQRELTLKGWHFIAIVKEGNKLKLFIDGAKDSETTLSSATISNNGPFYIGKDPWSPGYKGAIDEFCVFDAALSDRTIEFMYDDSFKFLPVVKNKYVEIAYDLLLTGIGTSYEEIRLLRNPTITEEKRQLAQRLGILLTPLDEINQISFKSGILQAERLERYFGLKAIESNPFSQPGWSQFLEWRLNYVAESWRQDDSEMNNLVIDPDIINEKEVAEDSQNVVLSIFKSRQKTLNDEKTRLNDLLRSKPTTQEKFNAILLDVSPNLDLGNLQQEEQIKGNNINNQLEAENLSRKAYNFLQTLKQLSAIGLVTDEEWDNLLEIMVKIFKIKKYNIWKDEEKNNAISISPRYFKIVSHDFVPMPWRTTIEERIRWEEILSARTDQRDALIANYEAMVLDVEKKALPLLRDGLVQFIAPFVEKAPGEIHDWLTERFLIEVKGGGNLITTRVEQAIETLQGIVFSIQTGRFPDWHPATNWKITEAVVGNEDPDVNFLEEWKWMGTYDAWRSAISVWLFPENYLFPAISPTKSPVFKKLTEEIRKFPSSSSSQDAISNLKDWKKTITQAPWNSATLYEKDWLVPMYIALSLQKSRDFIGALEWYRKIYDYEKPFANRKISSELSSETNTEPDLSRNSHWTRQHNLNPHAIATHRRDDLQQYNHFTRFTLLSLISCFVEYADAEFTRESFESIAKARSLYLTAKDLLGLDDLKMPAVTFLIEPLLPNPVLEMLNTKVELQLTKLRQGKNIAGILREIIIPNNSGLDETIGFDEDGNLQSSSMASFSATPYRFKFIMERSKHLVNVAQQIESSYISALEKMDNAAYRKFEATKGLEVAQANVQVHMAREMESQQAEIVAAKQLNKIRLLYNDYDRQINNGLIASEKAMLEGYWEMKTQKDTLAGIDAAIGAAQFSSSVATLFDVVLSAGVKQAIAAAGVAAHAAKAITSGFLNYSEATLQSNSLLASHERRTQEWQLQRHMAAQDIIVSMEQISLAAIHTQVVQEERKVAELQVQQAIDTLNYLDLQFFNVEMYEWMSQVLGEVYTYFLQQATAMAKLAQQQLSFERQSVVPFYIKSDYWVLPNKLNSSSTTSSEDSTPDRKGLLGAELLLRDIYQLDQYAFETEKRLLNLTQSFSLAQTFPLDFQEIRRTGLLRFSTPMLLFDRDFPGHYLRLIKKVKITVIALIPPTRGIRATLGASGVSRVVVRERSFQEKIIYRESEYVALTSPASSAGVFEMDTQSDLQFPFEGYGVDTNWEFSMPKAANPFDFKTIADVILSIDYVALNSNEYRQQVIKSLPRQTKEQRFYSIRENFPDTWYDLLNTELINEQNQLLISLKIEENDFPSNLRISQVDEFIIYIVKIGTSFEVPIGIEFNGKQGQQKIKTTVDGVLSTRTRAAVWKTDLELGGTNRLPFGEWQLDLRGENPVEMEQISKSFKDGDIKDILFILNYSARLPEWV